LPVAVTPIELGLVGRTRVMCTSFTVVLFYFATVTSSTMAAEQVAPTDHIFRQVS